jgi:hypothetical protein
MAPRVFESDFLLFQIACIGRGRQLALPISTALAVEAGIGAVVMQHWLLGKSLIGLACVLAVVTVSREAGARTAKTAGPANRAALSLLVAVALALAGQALPFQQKFRKPAPGSANHTPEEAHRAGGAYVLAAANGTSARREAPQQIIGGANGGYPGVILWPEVRPITLLVPPLPSGTGRLKMSRNPLGIPFGGEYWMYRDPSRRPPPSRSYFRRGSPLMGVFQTTDHLPLRMEARHKLEQTINIRCCSEVRLLILNADSHASEVSIELTLLGPKQKLGPELSLGSAGILSHPASTKTPAQETVSYVVPPVSYRFDEFRVVFHRSSNRSDKSALIALDRFTLIPR